MQFGKRKEPGGRLKFPKRLIFEKTLGAIMINNSSLRKWDRLAKKQLGQQFMNEIIQGLQCSPFEANAILDTVYKVYAPYFDTSGSLKPGQVLFQVVSIENGASIHLENCKQITVTLTLDAEEEDLKIREKEGVIGLRRHRIQRVCEEAFQQGGLLTVEDLANRLFNCGERTISRDIKALKKKDIVLPLRSTIKDMGRSISHRSLIVKEWLLGKEYSDVSRNTHHSIPSVKNYVNKFKRVVALAEEGFDVNSIAFLVKISSSLVEEYHKLYKTLDIVPHRRSELKSFLKQQEDLQKGGKHSDD
jgi:hypothetical protein